MRERPRIPLLSLRRRCPTGGDGDSFPGSSVQKVPRDFAGRTRSGVNRRGLRILRHRVVSHTVQ